MFDLSVRMLRSVTSSATLDEVFNLFELFGLKWDREYYILRITGENADKGLSRVPDIETM